MIRYVEHRRAEPQYTRFVHLQISPTPPDVRVCRRLQPTSGPKSAPVISRRRRRRPRTPSSVWVDHETAHGRGRAPTRRGRRPRVQRPGRRVSRSLRAGPRRPHHDRGALGHISGMPDTPTGLLSQALTGTRPESSTRPTASSSCETRPSPSHRRGPLLLLQHGRQRPRRIHSYRRRSAVSGLHQRGDLRPTRDGPRGGRPGGPVRRCGHHD